MTGRRSTDRDNREARDPAERRADHAAIDRLVDDVLPRLISRLGSSSLGEIEVREDQWRVRLRRPAPSPTHPAEPREGRGDRGERAPRPGTHAPRSAAVDGNGSGPATAIPARRELAATSPAVGVFQPRADVRAGMRVRAGDRLGVVDLLGVPQEVIAPADGVVAETLVGSGEGVEYGQDLVLIEPAAGA